MMSTVTRFLTNKHVVIAMLVTPILAIIAYFAVDAAVTEPPTAAQPGQSYPLAVRSNCRYTSGFCALENGDMKLKLESDGVQDNTLTLRLASALPLEGAQISMTHTGTEPQPQSMQATDETGTAWQVSLPAPTDAQAQIRLAVSVDGSYYFAEAPTTFIEHKTFYSEHQKAQDAS
ncbi:hypothetical protein BZJ17_10805 [Salinivibrio sp. IB574]|uniref:hypothetical protein n=1 Tax=Salinivibrio sp. IB574 TaxID=1909444 RepID=UPI0009C73BB4|nr:hypothetical protein [Salinivibrio sp. IB574]OOF20992.1 hypothetical protein BZJ17_10805 [Salinivibrio sp. IB574]